MGHRLERLSRFAPGCQATNNHKRVEAFFLQLQRHPGAGRFACSSAIKIDVLVMGKSLQFFV